MFGTVIPNHLKSPVAGSSEFDRLNEMALRDGWRQAIEDFYQFEPARIRYSTEASRFRFIELLPLDRESTVLEIGSSLGQITCALAERAAFVHALEVVPGQAQFTFERCRQEGLSNVAVTCGGDDCRLPQKDGAMDGVVLNLVLEWCGDTDKTTPLRESQQRLLRECRRVLRPGGWFFVATKNRYGLPYLLGGPDEHTFSWPFGQALPRCVVATLLRLHGKSRPGGLIHSYGALSRMITAAGFSGLKPYWAVPDFRFPREFVPVDAASITAARRRPSFVQPNDRKIAKLLMRFVPPFLVKQVMPGLIFLAENPQ